MLFSPKKRAVSFLMALLLLLGSIPVALAVQYPCIGFAVTGTSLRRSTSSQGETVASVRAGDALYITGESGSYYIVEYEGKLG